MSCTTMPSGRKKLVIGKGRFQRLPTTPAFARRSLCPTSEITLILILLPGKVCGRAPAICDVQVDLFLGPVFQQAF